VYGHFLLSYYHVLSHYIFRCSTYSTLLLHCTTTHFFLSQVATSMCIYSHHHNNKEEEVIAQILENNGYSPQTKNKRPSKNNIVQKDKWITFMYTGPSVRTITKLFRNTNMKVAFRTNNTIKQHIKAKEKITDKYDLCGVYQMSCKDCNLKYISQTGRTFLSEK
jgi:hypothetical protein